MASAPVSARAKGILLAVVLAGLLVGVRRPVGFHDEGYVLFGASRILAGELPYRDFWLVYAPAQFYVVAALFRAFGTSVLVARLYDTLVRLALLVAVYRVSRRLVGPAAALAPAAVAFLSLASIGFYGYPVLPALALVLASVECLLRRFAGGGAGTALTAGALLGAAATFRQDIGGAGIIVEGAVLAAFAWAADGSPARAGRALLPFVAGVATVLVVTTGLLVRAVPARELWWDMVVFPTTVLHETRRLPLPAFPSSLAGGVVTPFLLVFAPPAVFAAALCALATPLRRWGTAVLALLGSVLFALALNRIDDVHVLQAAIVAAMVATVLVSDLARVAPRPLWLGAAALAAGLFGAPYVVLPAARLVRLARAYVAPTDPSTLPANAGVSAVEDQEAAVRWVQAHTAPDERVLVANSRHDRIFVNDLMFYVLAARGTVTRHHSLEPDVATTRPVQQEIIADLERHDTRCVVLFAKFENYTEPNRSGQSSGVTDLDDYLRARYAPVARFGDYTILERTGG
jgi:hypothetical protein